MNLPHKILAVEDDKEMRELLGDFLAHQGFFVKTFANAEETLEYLKKDPEVEVVISDIKLPGMKGIELADKLQEQRRIPTILITAYGNADQARQAAQAGAYAYVMKPFHLSHIAQLIDGAIKIRKKRA